ncbi:MAG TPA: hypothetical protein DCM05_15905 [Elusimicrobia bacterium]|nr:hypothetical protein [Elusimicrobiota bacterium]
MTNPNRSRALPGPKCLGILREMQNSPNRETDDAQILNAVLEQLRNLGARTDCLTPEEADRRELSDYDLLLPMCETYPRIKRLAGCAQRTGARWFNPPEAVLNCYRLEMISRLARAPEVRFPRCEVRRVQDGPGPAPFQAPATGPSVAGAARAEKHQRAAPGYWLKRGDVHNTCDHDVVFAAHWAHAGRVVEDFAQREITHFVVQPHIEGDILKFYGVGPGRWFTWFHHDPTRARRTPFVMEELASMAAAGARALGLEIYGGDAIVSPDGSITLLDLNSWPSFARVRQEAALQIAWHLQARWLSRRAKTRTQASSSARRRK